MNTPEHEPDFKCATFSPAMQAAIPPHIRAKMDADRAAAIAAKTGTVWLLEAPAHSGYYLAAQPIARGKLGEQTEIGTHTAQFARQFESRAACEEYIAANPTPPWMPTEHIFG